MRYEVMVALRFLRAGRTQTALVFGGATAGVAVIVFLTALLSGLQQSLVDKTLGAQAHVVVKPRDLVTRRLMHPGPDEAISAVIERPAQRQQWIDEWPKLMRMFEGLEGVVAVSPVVGGAGFAHRGRAERQVTILGGDPERFERIIPLSKKLLEGTARVSGGEAAIGIGLADDLGVRLGDKIRVESSAGREEIFTIVGIFRLGAEPVNKRWTVISLRDAQALFGIPGAVTSIDIRIADIFAADQLAGRVEAMTGLAAESWMKTNADLLIGLKGQNNSGMMIAVFVIIAVALGIASVLIVSVVQKSREIGILRATGTTAKAIQRIFLIQGGLTGAFASVFGGLLGAALAKFFENLARQPDGSPTFPVDLGPGLFIAAAAMAIATGLAASFGPARRAASLDPATAIRHE